MTDSQRETRAKFAQILAMHGIQLEPREDDDELESNHDQFQLRVTIEGNDTVHLSILVIKESGNVEVLSVSEVVGNGESIYLWWLAVEDLHPRTICDAMYKLVHSEECPGRWITDTEMTQYAFHDAIHGISIWLNEMDAAPAA